MKATPADMRKILEAVQAYKDAMIAFVPVPVLGADDSNWLVAFARKRLETLLKEAEEKKHEQA